MEFAIQQISYVDAGVTAAQAGCDALVFNTLSAYGYSALRVAVDIPVISPSEATYRFGQSLGPRFSIVTVWPPSGNYKQEATMRELGVDGNCVRIHNVFGEDAFDTNARPDAFISSMQSGRDGKLEKIVAACERAVAEDRIDYIVLGCTCMSPLADKIHERCEVPVLSPLAVAVKTAEMHVRLGLAPKGPRRTRPRAESYELIKRMVDPVSAPAADCGIYCAL